MHRTWELGLCRPMHPDPSSAWFHSTSAPVGPANSCSASLSRQFGRSGSSSTRRAILTVFVSISTLGRPNAKAEDGGGYVVSHPWNGRELLPVVGDLPGELVTDELRRRGKVGGAPVKAERGQPWCQLL